MAYQYSPSAVSDKKVDKASIGLQISHMLFVIVSIFASTFLISYIVSVNAENPLSTSIVSIAIYYISQFFVFGLSYFLMSFVFWCIHCDGDFCRKRTFKIYCFGGCTLWPFRRCVSLGIQRFEGGNGSKKKHVKLFNTLPYFGSCCSNCSSNFDGLFDWLFNIFCCCNLCSCFGCHSTWRDIHDKVRAPRKFIVWLFCIS